MCGARGCVGMLRSFHPEKTPSHQNWEVNLDWAVSVLGREITWEPTVTAVFCTTRQRAGLPAWGESMVDDDDDDYTGLGKARSMIIAQAEATQCGLNQSL